MKIADLSPEEQQRVRECNNERKRRQRNKEKAERLARQIPDAADYELPEVQQRALSEHSNSILKSIRAEVDVTEQDIYVIDCIARVSLGLENNYAKKVNEPFGVLIGGYFPDAAWSTAIEHVHRFPSLLQSATFADLYHKFLAQVTKWNNQTHGAYSAPEFVADLKSEIAGTYVLPTSTLPEPHKPPAPVEPPAGVPGSNLPHA
jgi:hypothetical protein